MTTTLNLPVLEESYFSALPFDFLEQLKGGNLHFYIFYNLSFGQQN